MRNEQACAESTGRDGDPTSIAPTPGASAARHTAARCALLLALACAALPGCGLGGRQRLADLGDVIDLKYGRAMGLGAKVEATLWLGAGLGFATIDSSTETYGRQVYEEYDGIFLHLVLVGVDAFSPHGGPPATWGMHVGPVNVAAFSDEPEPEDIDRIRFGGELLLPFVHGGLYLNLGQLFDLGAGLFGFDPADDDDPPVAGRRPRPEAPSSEPSGMVDD